MDIEHQPTLESEPSATTREASQAFVGRWHRLISVTNWEKGRIVADWRAALVASGVPASQYSDEAWSQMVGGVTSQHVGRLRRVYQRFADQYAKFEGLYWSHFQAALEWSDAEMWLEGAVQSAWSVADMRARRSETLDHLEAHAAEIEITTVPFDEDAEVTEDERPAAGVVQGQYDVVRDHEDQESAAPDAGRTQDRSESSDDAATPTAKEPRVRLFAQVGDLPDDLAEAYEALKLSILRHKAEGWQQVACEDVVAALEALKQLAMAPAD